MTTAARYPAAPGPVPVHSGNGSLLRAGALVLVLVAAAAAIGGLVSGRDAALGAGLGGGVVWAVCVGGVLVVNTVAWIAPRLALVFAMSTYLLQVLALGLLLAGLARREQAGAAVDLRAAAIAAMAVVVAWSVALVRAHVTARIPAFEIAPAPAADPAQGPVTR